MALPHVVGDSLDLAHLVLIVARDQIRATPEIGFCAKHAGAQR